MISDAYWNIRIGIRNLIRWTPIIWRDRDFDWDYLARIMERKMTWMADRFESPDCPVSDAKRMGRQVRTCAILLRRLMDDDYFENAGYGREAWLSASDRKRSRMAYHARDMAEQDKRYLGKLIGKYLDHWWD